MQASFRRYIDDLGGLGILAWDTVRYGLRPPYGFRLLLDQLYNIGVLSLSIVSIVALFTGLVIAVQTAYSLANYGGQVFIGDLVALSLVRELGPVLTCLMIAGRAKIASAIPFGPFLAVAGWVSLYWGDVLIRAFWGLALP